MSMFACASLVPLAFCSFSVLISKLLHTHCVVTGSVCGTFVGSLAVSVLCLCAIAGAVAVLCSSSVLILRLGHITVCSSVEISLYGCSEEGDGYDAYD